MTINGLPPGSLTTPKARPIASIFPPTGPLLSTPTAGNPGLSPPLFTLLADMNAAMQGSMQPQIVQNTQATPEPQQPIGFVPPGLAKKPGHLPPGIYKKLYGGHQPAPIDSPGTSSGVTPQANSIQNPGMAVMMLEMLLSKAQPTTATLPLPLPSGNVLLGNSPSLAPIGNNTITMQPQGLNTLKGTLQALGLAPS